LWTEFTGEDFNGVFCIFFFGSAQEILVIYQGREMFGIEGMDNTVDVKEYDFVTGHYSCSTRYGRILKERRHHKN
jgi:hypothetical protein